MGDTTFDVIVRAIPDTKSIADVQKALEGLTKSQRVLTSMKVDWKQIAKQSSTNVKQLDHMAKAAQLFASRLKDATSKSLKGLTDMGEELSKLHDAAGSLSDQLGQATDDASKNDITERLEATNTRIKALNKQIDVSRDLYKKEGAELSKVIKAQQKYQKTVEGAASFSAKDMGKGLLDSFKQMASGKSGIASGMSGLIKNLGKGAMSGRARMAKSSAASAGGMDSAGGIAEIASAGKQLGAAAIAIGAVAGSFALLIKFLQAASDHISTLNKALLQGVAIGGDIGRSTAEYGKSIKNMRNAAKDAHFEMLKFGGDSEKSLKSVSAFTKEASGSMITMEDQLTKMGGGDIKKGMVEFSKSTLLYGKALGMEATETASMMGKFVSEIGVSTDNVMGTMDMVMKQAVQSNMPVTKFMDIFRQTIPSVDMYTNRMEELTGVIKLLSKTMSARDVKKFMDAFGRGFDQVDFKQRLKMVKVVGEGRVKSIMQKSLTRAQETIGNQFGPRLSGAFNDAMKAVDPVKAMRKTMGDAMALGDTAPGAIGAAAKVARSQRLLNKGGSLNTAGAMRGAGTFARMQILEEFAAKLPGGNIEGLGEHVAKQLGVSEQEYSAILQLQDSMGAYMSQVTQYGRTSSKSMNDFLLAQVGGDEEKLKEMARNNPKKLEELMKISTAQKMEDDKKTATSMADIGKLQYQEMSSISDKFESIMKYLLEKIYFVVDDILSLLNNLWAKLTGEGDTKVTASAKDREFRNEMMTSGKEMGRERADLFSTKIGELTNTLGDESKGKTTMDRRKAALAGNEELVDSLYGKSSEDLKSTLLKAGYSEEEAAQFEKTRSSDKPEGEKREAFERLLTAGDTLLTAGTSHQGSTDKQFMNVIAGELGDAVKNAKPGELTSKLDQEAMKNRRDIDKAMKTKPQREKDDQDLKLKNMVLTKVQRQNDAAGTPAWQGPTQRPQDIAAAAANRLMGGNPEGLPPDPSAGAAGARAGVHRTGSSNITTKTDKTTLGELLAALVSVSEYVSTTAGYSPDIEVTADKSFDIADGINDIGEILDAFHSTVKSGVDFTGGFVNGTYKNVLKGATLESFRIALLEFAIIYAKMWGEESFRKQLVGGGAEFMGEGGTMAGLIDKINTDNPVAKAQAIVRGSHDFGTSHVNSTGLYHLQRGEQVVSADDAKRGRSQNVTNNIVINGTSLSPSELQHAIEAGVHNVMRKT